MLSTSTRTSNTCTSTILGQFVTIIIKGIASTSTGVKVVSMITGLMLVLHQFRINGYSFITTTSTTATRTSTCSTKLQHRSRDFTVRSSTMLVNVLSNQQRQQQRPPQDSSRLQQLRVQQFHRFRTSTSTRMVSEDSSPAGTGSQTSTTSTEDISTHVVSSVMSSSVLFGHIYNQAMTRANNILLSNNNIMKQNHHHCYNNSNSNSNNDNDNDSSTYQTSTRIDESSDNYNYNDNDNDQVVLSILDTISNDKQRFVSAANRPEYNTMTSFPLVNNLLDSTLDRTRRTIMTKKLADVGTVQEQQQHQQHDERDTTINDNTDCTRSDGTNINVISTDQLIDTVQRNYGSNPSITLTALAHLLWKSIQIRPGIDTVIDATAGNGYDSIQLAKILFTSNHNNYNNNEQPTNIATTNITSNSQLICIDIQEESCVKTENALRKLLPEHIFQNNVQILCSSHATLPSLSSSSSSIHNNNSNNNNTNSTVALIVYNLGYLPDERKPLHTKQPYMTTSTTTLASLVDAVLLIRIGGMISIITYPRSNPQEDIVVRTFLEGLAMFSSTKFGRKNYTSSTNSTLSTSSSLWEEYMEQKISNLYTTATGTIPTLVDDSLRQQLILSLRHVYEHGGIQQTWRVHEHKKIGWIDAPILITATKIKS